MQISEIDALAYSSRLIHAGSGINSNIQTHFSKVNKKIETYAKTLNNSLFLAFEGMFK